MLEELLAGLSPEQAGVVKAALSDPAILRAIIMIAGETAQQLGAMPPGGGGPAMPPGAMPSSAPDEMLFGPNPGA